MERDSFRKIKVNQLPRNANVLGGRFVYTLKNAGLDNEQPKARYVAQGHKDREKPFIVHSIPTLRQSSTKILVSTAAVRGFRIFSHDVKQEYLQSKDKMTRILYLKPKEEDRKLFGINCDEVLEILKPLYGVCDAGDYWGITIITHVEEDLLMTPFAGDPSLYMKCGQGNIEGLLGAYVDDCLLAGDERFQTLTEKMLLKFNSRPREWDNVTFLGVSIRTIQNSEYRWFEMQQPEYIANLKIVPQDTTFSRFRTIRAIFAWLSHSRPDLCCAINRAAQVTTETFCSRDIK